MLSRADENRSHRIDSPPQAGRRQVSAELTGQAAKFLEIFIKTINPHPSFPFIYSVPKEMNAGELPQYLTPLQFAAVTRSHKRSVLNAIATGRIRCERLEHHTLVIPASEISRLYRRENKRAGTIFRKR